MAVQFCSRKVAAIHGDARKALDICRAAIELVETQQRCQKGKPTNTSSSHVSAARVTIGHVASVVSKVYGGGRTEEAMPVQQKLAVCSLLLMVRERSTKEVTLSKVCPALTTCAPTHPLSTHVAVPSVHFSMPTASTQVRVSDRVCGTAADAGDKRYREHKAG